MKNLKEDGTGDDKLKDGFPDTGGGVVPPVKP